MERKFHGLTRSQLNTVLNILCELEDKMDNLSAEETNAFNIGIQCVAQIVTRMADKKPITWD